MFTKTAIIALAAAAAAQAATPQGFNYAAQGRGYDQFKKDFENAQKLTGAGTFNAARLYTMIQDKGDWAKKGTYYIEALQAAVDTKTYLLLGMWASGGSWDMEMNALNQVLTSMPDLAQYVLGLSVGSEDLYRASPVGIQSSPEAGPGQSPDTLKTYIGQVKDTLKQHSSWSGVKVGHVDTWTAWVNGSNSAVIDAADFLGVDAYPYFQNTEANGIAQGKDLFNEAMDKTKGVANGKEVWITETGWPVTGKQENQATANTDNAKTYWQQVGCPNFGNTPTFWYTYHDDVAPTADKPSFSITDSSFTPLFDLSCDNVAKDDNTTSSSTSSSSATSTGSSTGTAAKSTSTGSSGSGSGSSNGTFSGSPSTPSGTTGSGSGSGSASGTGTTSGTAASGSAPATGSASTLSFSFISMAALAAGVVALL